MQETLFVQGPRRSSDIVVNADICMARFALFCIISLSCLHYLVYFSTVLHVSDGTFIVILIILLLLLLSGSSHCVRITIISLL